MQELESEVLGAALERSALQQALVAEQGEGALLRQELGTQVGQESSGTLELMSDKMHAGWASRWGGKHCCCALELVVWCCKQQFQQTTVPVSILLNMLLTMIYGFSSIATSPSAAGGQVFCSPARDAVCD